MSNNQGINRKGNEVTKWAYQYKEIYKGTDMEFWASKAVQAVYSLRKSYGRLASMRKNQFILDAFCTWISGYDFSQSHEDVNMAADGAIATLLHYRRYNASQIRVGRKFMTFRWAETILQMCTF